MSLNQIDIATPEQVSLNYKIAGLGSRATAHILDWLILFLIAFALSFGLGLLFDRFSLALNDTVFAYIGAIGLVLVFLLFWGYFLLFEFFAAGRTPGKRLAGIKVIQDNGHSLTFLTSAVRNLIRIIDFLPGLYLLGILMIFFHSRHKRIGDLAAGTVVIYQSKTRHKKKKTQLEMEIDRKLKSNPVNLQLDDWTVKKFGLQEWKLIRTYIQRRPALTSKEQREMSQQVAGILFPLLGLETANQPPELIENHLFALYLLLKEEWQYDGS